MSFYPHYIRECCVRDHVDDVCSRQELLLLFLRVSTHYQKEDFWATKRTFFAVETRRKDDSHGDER